MGQGDEANHPAAGKAAIERLFAIEHHWPSLPEPIRLAVNSDNPHGGKKETRGRWRIHPLLLLLLIIAVLTILLALFFPITNKPPM